MNFLVLSFFLFIGILVSFGGASIAQKLVKDGERAEISTFRDAKAIIRQVEAGEQVFHIEGEHKGSFVDVTGKEVDSSNYEQKDGVFIIKKFTKADVGAYSEYPPKVILKKTEHGFEGVPGPTLQLSLYE